MAAQQQPPTEEQVNNIAPPVAPNNEEIVDIELDDFENEDTDDSFSVSRNRTFRNSSEIRRRLEERLEIKRLREQLGMDDFDF